MSTDYITNRFDRQNRVYGIEGTKKLQNANIVICGQKCDVLFEVAKNLVLGGVQNIRILYDKIPYVVKTIESTSDSNIVDISKVTNTSRNFLGNVHNYNYDQIIHEISLLNPYCKIVSEQSNDNINSLCNTIFIMLNDSINNTISLNQLRSQNNKFIVLQYNKLNELTIINDFVNHTVIDIDGENYELLTINSYEQTDNIITIKTISPHDLSNNDQIKIILTNNIQYISYVNKLIDLNTFELIIDKSINNNEMELIFVNGYVQKLKSHIELCHKPINELIDNNLNTNELNLYDVNPIIQSFIGAIITSECVKAITNKYLPYDQSYIFEFNKDVFLKPTEELQNKLSKLKIFIVGSGAIGCELLKNLAMIRANNISITDPDHIEVSNLSRQFLFSNKNVGFSKSEIASKRIMKYNNNMKIIPYQQKLTEENQKFVDEIFPNTDIIFNALDNLSARLYVDKQAIKFTKPLFESGTLGTKGNTQPIIPHITESYGASQDQQQEKSFAVCTIKNFPTQIQHTIHYAMDDFNGLFCQQPQQLKKFLSEHDPFVNVSDIEMTIIKSFLHRIIKYIYQIKSINNYIEWAYCLWYDRFNRRINRLLTAHPENSLTSNGQLFWSNGKRCPNVQPNNTSEFFDYMFATTNLLMFTYNLKSLTFDPSIDIKNIIQNYDYSQINTEKYIDDPDHNFEHLKLPTIPYLDIDINPQEFEKDDDNNFHIAYITATSNCRASIYSIPTASFYETKGIAGKIIPALATTTSIVASLITLEMMKYVIDNKRPIEDYQSYFVNLANNLFIPGEPIPPKKTTINNIQFTEWDSFEYSGDLNMNIFLELLNKKFNTIITMVTYGQKILYANFSKNCDTTKSLSDMILNNCSENEKYYKVQLYVGTDDDEIELPLITINI